MVTREEGYQQQLSAAFILDFHVSAYRNNCLKKLPASVCKDDTQLKTTETADDGIYYFIVLLLIEVERAVSHSGCKWILFHPIHQLMFYQYIALAARSRCLK